MRLINRSTGVMGPQTMNWGSTSPIVCCDECSHIGTQPGLFIHARPEAVLSRHQQRCQHDRACETYAAWCTTWPYRENASQLLLSTMATVLPTLTCYYFRTVIKWLSTFLGIHTGLVCVRSCSGSFLHPECYCLLLKSKICPSLGCDSSNTFSMKFYSKKKIKFPGYSSLSLPDIYSIVPCLSLACTCQAYTTTIKFATDSRPAYSSQSNVAAGNTHGHADSSYFLAIHDHGLPVGMVVIPYLY